MATTPSVGRRTFLLSAAATGLNWVVTSPTAAASDLQSAAHRGLAERGVASAAYWRRLDHELQVIARLDLERDFLTMRDLVGWARREAIPIFPGYGPQSGSLVCWSLGLSELDPLKHGLLFETFIQEHRFTHGKQRHPAFCVAVCAQRQPEIMEYLQRTLGADRVALAQWDRDQAQALVSAAEVALGHDDTPAMGLMGDPPERDARLPLAQLLATDERLIAGPQRDPRARRAFEVALEFERDPAFHFAPDPVVGDIIVISMGRPLRPTQYQAMRGRALPIVNLDDNDGHMTLSCPPLRSLTVLGMINAEARRAPSVYEMIASGDTTGVGLESHMRHYLGRLRPCSLEEVAAAFAIHTTGDRGNLAEDFLARKHGHRPPRSLHPLVERALASTHDALLYQEQQLDIIRDVAGFDLRAANLMRRALVRWSIRPRELEPWRVAFVRRAAGRGVGLHDARRILLALQQTALRVQSRALALCRATISMRTASREASRFL